MPKYTPENIKRIANFMRSAKDISPFALITGAGCSKSAGIPLAGELVVEICSSLRFEPHIADLSDAERSDYGKVMACLELNARRALLHPYLDSARINWGHIAIAAMMQAGYVGRVLTFNFDNILARACGICGLYPATYDFVTGASKSTDHIVSPSIIHLHGQGYGLSMLNSKQETEKHAKNLGPLIVDTFSKSSVLVIGYSGRSDAVFPKIKAAFGRNERLFWVGYGDSPEKHVSELLAKPGTLPTFIGGADSDQFLMDLARELGCWPPMLFSNPVAHIRREIEPVAPFPLGRNSGTHNVLDDLNETLEQYESNASVARANTKALTSLLKGEFKQVLELRRRGETVSDELTYSALFSQGNSLFEKAEATGVARLFDRASAKYEAALAIKPDNHNALNNWGVALSGKAKATGDARLFDRAIEKYEAALAIKPDNHDDLNNWGGALSGKAEATGDARLFDRASEKYEAALAIKPD